MDEPVNEYVPDSLSRELSCCVLDRTWVQYPMPLTSAYEIRAYEEQQQTRRQLAEWDAYRRGEASADSAGAEPK